MAGQLLTSVGNTQTANSAGANITGYGLQGLTNMATNLPTVGTIIILVVIISLIIGVLYFVRGSGPGGQ